MKRYAWAGMLALMMTGCCHKEQSLHVGTFNVRQKNLRDSLEGNGWVQRLPAVCELVRYHDFDIFGAQEVKHEQLTDMLGALPEYAYIGVGRDDGDTKGEYVPVFYKTERFSLIESGHFWLSEQTDHPNKGWDANLPRICTWGKFRDRQAGKTFWFFNTHFDHIGRVARKESAKLMLDKIGTMAGGDPVVVTGDFNVTQHDESYALLARSERLSDCYETAEVRYAPNGTFQGFDVNRKTPERIDHIFVSRDFATGRYGILTDMYWAEVPADSTAETTPKFQARTPSDHYPVAAVLTYR